MNIIWRGNEFTNHSSRQGHIPIAIVNHITTSTWSSCDNWFRSSGNKGSSAHFCVAKDGAVRQYVKIEESAWANGITTARFNKVTSDVVKSKGSGISVNRYTISIENEGTDGNLTEAQFKANVELTKYIRDYVKKVYNYEIPLDRKHVIGHYEIDPIDRPNCPGKKFPWDKLIKALSKKEEEMKTFKDWNSISDWAKASVDRVSDLGIIKGSDGSFLPKNNLTREEAAVIIDRILKYLGK